MTNTKQTRDRLVAHCDAPEVYDPPTMTDVLRLVKALEEDKQELVLQGLSDMGQASEAHSAQLKAEAESARLRNALEAIYTSRVTYYTAESDLTRLREIARAALQEDEG